MRRRNEFYSCSTLRAECTLAENEAKNTYFFQNGDWKLKTANSQKNFAKNLGIGPCGFLGCFWAYVGQPHDHICWATPISFASINPNVWCIEFRSKHNCTPVLCLLGKLMHQTLLTQEIIPKLFVKNVENWRFWKSLHF